MYGIGRKIAILPNKVIEHVPEICEQAFTNFIGTQLT